MRTLSWTSRYPFHLYCRAEYPKAQPPLSESACQSGAKLLLRIMWLSNHCKLKIRLNIWKHFEIAGSTEKHSLWPRLLLCPLMWFWGMTRGRTEPETQPGTNSRGGSFGYHQKFLLLWLVLALWWCLQATSILPSRSPSSNPSRSLSSHPFCFTHPAFPEGCSPQKLTPLA